jgi:hypothetical protein
LALPAPSWQKSSPGPGPSAHRRFGTASVGLRPSGVSPRFRRPG